MRSIRMVMVFAMTMAVIVMYITTAHSAEYCVDTAGELHSALFDSESSTEDDYIKIVQGTYSGTFVYSNTYNKLITIEGGYTQNCTSVIPDPSLTVLDGHHITYTLRINHTGGGSVDISNVTVRNAEDNGGLNISVNSGDVSLSRVIATENDSVGVSINGANNISIVSSFFTKNTHGRGLEIPTAGTVVISGSRFLENSVVDGGAGMYAYAISSISVEQSVFSQNQSTGYWGHGAGAYLQCNTVNIDNSSFISNTSVGGFFAAPRLADEDSTINIIDNVFYNNFQDGVVVPGFWHVRLENNRIQSNIGKAVYISTDYDCILINNVITDNINSVWNDLKGAVYINCYTSTIANNTIYNNSTIRTEETYAGAINLTIGEGTGPTSNTGFAKIYNNIIWGNHADIGADLYIDNDHNGDFIRSTVELHHNDFDQTMDSGFYIKLYIPVDPTNLNNSDPLFLAPGSGDYHLSSTSPCIDAGTPEGAPVLDFEGDARPLGDAFDIGADEFSRYIPVISSYAINNGAFGTSSTPVTLNNSVSKSTPTHYMASESSEFAGGSWQPYSTAPPFTLSSEYGIKTVYFKVKNGAGESDAVSDTIVLRKPVKALPYLMLLTN